MASFGIHSPLETVADTEAGGKWAEEFHGTRGWEIISIKNALGTATVSERWAMILFIRQPFAGPQTLTVNLDIRAIQCRLDPLLGASPSRRSRMCKPKANRIPANCDSTQTCTTMHRAKPSPPPCGTSVCALSTEFGPLPTGDTDELPVFAIVFAMRRYPFPFLLTFSRRNPIPHTKEARVQESETIEKCHWADGDTLTCAPSLSGGTNGFRFGDKERIRPMAAEIYHRVLKIY